MKVEDGPSNEQINGYYNLLDSSFTKIKDFIDEKEIKLDPFETVYLGGGTPSLWKDGLASSLELFFNNHGLGLSESCEFTVECNPDSIDLDVIQNWKNFGVNRISMGIQSLDSALFKYLDRVHSIDQSYQALEILQQSKLNFSADLMIGLPRPKGHKRDIKKEIEEIISFGAKHLSLYILKVNKSYIHFDLLPDEEAIEAEYFELVEVLAENGFEQYEVSNFSIPGYESKHNKKYWNLDSVLALGPSATGYFASEKMRYKWKTDKNNFVEENLSLDEAKLEKIYLNLRTNTGVTLKDFEVDNSKNSNLSELVKSWELRGLAVVNDGKLKLNKRGYILMDTLMSELFSNNIL